MWKNEISPIALAHLYRPSQRRPPESWASFFCSLNFLLSLVGYGLTMALLAPFGANVDVSLGENIYFTYPYRVFQILVSLSALYTVRNHPLPRINFKILLIVIYWILYFTRAFWDLFISNSHTTSSILYVLCYIIVDFLPLLAIMKGWDQINFTQIRKWILVLGFLGLIFCLRNMQSQIQASWTGDIGRVAATAMLHTQALGTFGTSIAIVAFFSFFSESKILFRLFSFFCFFLAVYMMLKAGSRGPFFGLFISIATWLACRRKNMIFVVLTASFFLTLFLIFQDQIIDFVSKISPTMAHRAQLTLSEGDTSGRDVLWKEFFIEIRENPIFGYKLDRFGSPHSMIFDGFMMFGVFGGWIVSAMIALGCLSLIKGFRSGKKESWWMMLLLLTLSQSFTGGQTSSCILQAPLLLIFILDGKGLLEKPFNSTFQPKRNYVPKN